jgi:hypothetical protein
MYRVRPEPLVRYVPRLPLLRVDTVTDFIELATPLADDPLAADEVEEPHAATSSAVAARTRPTLKAGHLGV